MMGDPPCTPILGDDMEPVMGVAGSDGELGEPPDEYPDDMDAERERPLVLMGMGAECWALSRPLLDDILLWRAKYVFIGTNAGDGRASERGEEES